MQVQNDKGEWVYANVAKGSEVSKDSKTRINVLVNPNMKESNSLGKFANIVTHELSVHGAGYIRAELNAALSKKGKSGPPNDAKGYWGEVDRVRASYQNINQITQLGIYGPAQ